MNTKHKNFAIWDELMRRGIVVRDDSSTPPGEKQRLLAEIVELGKRARDGGVPREDLENHQLNWIAYCASLRHNLVRAMAQALINCENDDNLDDLDLNMRQTLYWWQNEGGKEELLGELTIEERHALEAAAH